MVAAEASKKWLRHPVARNAKSSSDTPWRRRCRPRRTASPRPVTEYRGYFADARDNRRARRHPGDSSINASLQTRRKDHELRLATVALLLLESLVKEVNYRAKGTEMFWNDPEGVEAILQVRAAALSDDERLVRHLDNRPGYPFTRRPRSSKAQADLQKLTCTPLKHSPLVILREVGDPGVVPQAGKGIRHVGMLGQGRLIQREAKARRIA
jgi:hypothetical protein